MQNEFEARARLRAFIIDNMDAFFDDSELNDSDNIFEKGFVSSIFAIRLLNFIEKEFGIEVLDKYIRLENFSSVDSMIRLVKQLKGDSSYAN